MTDGEWTAVCALRDLRVGRPSSFVVAGRAVAILRTKEACRAFSDRCPHNGLPLHDSSIDGTVITCRWHGWRFDLVNGLCPDLDPGVEGPRLRIYPVRERDGLIEIRVD